MGTSAIGPGWATAQTSMQQVRETQLLKSVGGGRVPTEDDKIEKGSRQFESMLLSSWLKQAEASFATVPGGDDTDDQAGHDQAMGLGVQALSDALVASGGIGLGAMIARAMHAKADAAQNVPAVGGPGMAQPTPAAAAFVPAAHPESVQNQAPTENSGKS